MSGSSELLTTVVGVSGVALGLMFWLVRRGSHANRALAEANAKITELNERLEEQVSGRTRELDAALAERQAILESLVDGLVATDGDGIVRLANPAVSRMFQVARDAKGRPASEVFPSELADVLVDAATTKAVTVREIPLPGGRTGKLVASPIPETAGTAGTAGGVVAVVRDVTLEKEVDRMKTDFIATVSHELRTPLTSVLGFAKITRNKLEERVFTHVPQADKRAVKAMEQARGNMEIIVREGERLTQLINDVLDISKMEAGRMEWKMAAIDVASLVTRTVDSCASLFAENGIELESVVEQDLPELRGDFDRLLQVLINLVSNAAKFTERGTVTVAAKRAGAGAGVELSVTDTGGGIDPTLHASIFEKFKQVGDTMTNRPKGTGLGLPICRQIVHAHGGDITVQSTLGGGATFAFVLPALVKDGVQDGARAERVPTSRPGPPQITLASQRFRSTHAGSTSLPAAAQAAEGEGRAAEGMEVLVVDDDASLRELLRQVLTEKGYRVRLAANGYEAINAVRARRPHLVILDVMMPDISGFDVAAVLKNDPTTEALPILMLSILQDSERGVKLGIDRHLTKPADAERLAATVRELIEKKTPRAILIVDDKTVDAMSSAPRA